ncbi:MAG: ATP-dependent DNA helicase RecG [Spirochaetia bacterium]|nr:ATP-dependent DNA helicase RecG [Spirochaetia bacterium]
MYLRNLNTPVSTLAGVGKQIGEAYNNLGVKTFGDLLQLVPRDYEDRTSIMPLALVPDGSYANTIVEVVSHSYFGMNRKRTLKVIIKDISGEGDARASLLCFNRNFLEKVLRVKSKFYLYGQFTHHYNELQSSQFEMIPLKDDIEEIEIFGKLLPIYPLSGRLSQNLIRKHISFIFNTIEKVENEIPEYLIEKYHLVSTHQAINKIHNPKNRDEIATGELTLAFTELFYLFLAIIKKRGIEKVVETQPITFSDLEKRCIASFPFSLTKDQEKVLLEIKEELLINSTMNRILQGDVGSGKTLVAWISSLHVISKKGQVAFMAPTELLARQHAEQAALYLEPLGVRIALFTGSVKNKARKYLLEALKNHEIDIAIGTHALFSSEVEFADLAYIIIDEQHRFGVVQRTALLAKGKAPDVLMMSATPIPRSLALTVFGDMNISTIREMPVGRIPIVTYLVSNESRKRMYESVSVEFERNHQAYFVYPRIDDKGESTLRDVTTMFEYLKEVYPNVPSALIHSRLDEQEKISIIRKFRNKELMYVVSTSVVEVGLDIPEATVMVIEHAERFGLSALHQLRGRVGRSILQSYCFLVYETPLSEDAMKRLKVLKESNDGFYIAEQDLMIRGPGEVVGTKQSGFLKLKFASLTSNIELLATVKKEVQQIIEDDEGFLELRHAPIRKVLLEAPYFSQQEENE